jgi:hypothetical protein
VGAGLAMSGISLASPLFLGAAVKIAYDILLYVSFRRIKPPEEHLEARPNEGDRQDSNLR